MQLGLRGKVDLAFGSNPEPWGEALDPEIDVSDPNIEKRLNQKDSKVPHGQSHNATPLYKMLRFLVSTARLQVSKKLRFMSILTIHGHLDII